MALDSPLCGQAKGQGEGGALLPSLSVEPVTGSCSPQGDCTQGLSAACALGPQEFGCKLMSLSALSSSAHTNSSLEEQRLCLHRVDFYLK